MPLYDPVLPVRYVSSLLELLEKLDVPSRRTVLSAAGVKVMKGQDQVLTMQQFDTLIASASKQLGRSDLGFELGLQIKLDHHQALAFVLQQSSSVDALMRQLCRFHRLITTCFAVSYTRKKEAGEFVCRPAAGMSPAALACFEELYAVSAYTDCSALLGSRMKMIDIHLSIPAPLHRMRYRELLKARVHFRASALPEVRIVFPQEILDIPLMWPGPQGSNDRGFAIASIEGLQAVRVDTAKAGAIREWVTLMLREAEGCQPTRKALAELLHVSPITLTRYLVAEGETLRNMGTRIRYRRAQAMLATSDESIARISERLGYSNCSAFTSSFQMLAGVSPREYRKGVAENHQIPFQ